MSIRVGMGTGLGLSLAPGDYWRWIDLCEHSGIDSIWHSDQLVGANPDPMVMMAALSARTARMRFGFNAFVMSFRDPLVVAKEFATIDFLSSGRLLPVLGVGTDSDPYWAATGRAAAERGRRSNEAISLVRQLLEQEQVAFQGDYFRYDGPGVLPRPCQPIPLWIGGHSKAAVARTAALGDGWLGGLLSARDAGETVARIGAALVATGRSIEADHYGVTLPLRLGSAYDPAVAGTLGRLQRRLPEDQRATALESLAVGEPAEVVERLRRYVEAGISKFVVMPMVDSAEDLMQQTRLLVRDVLPSIEDRNEDKVQRADRSEQV